jgi:hypothetical protein
MCLLCVLTPLSHSLSLFLLFIVSVQDLQRLLDPSPANNAWLEDALSPSTGNRELQDMLSQATSSVVRLSTGKSLSLSLSLSLSIYLSL